MTTVTKPTNKAREFQDAVNEAIENGCSNPLDIAERIYSWHVKSDRAVKLSTLQYAVAHILPTVTEKRRRVLLPVCISAVEPAPTPQLLRRLREREQLAQLPSERLKEIDDYAATCRREQELHWLAGFLVMKGSQLRAIRALPEEMISKVGDDQCLGDVFTFAELEAALLQHYKGA